MIVAFVVPVVLAKLALDYDWFNKAVTNKGTLINPTIEAVSLLSDSERKWHFVYLLPASCDKNCENAIYSIQQVHQALGREKERVNPLFIATEQSDKDLLAQLVEQVGVEVLQKQHSEVEEIFGDLQLDAIFIADTWHNLVLYYPNTHDQQQAIMDSKDMLSDMRKLLKLSHIG